MRVLVCGGRYFRDRDLLWAALDRLDRERGITLVIEGGNRTRDRKTRKIIGGADYWANQWAVHRGRECKTYPANWDRYGDRAGPIRNSEMLADGRPDIVVHAPGGTGTADMVRKARAAPGVEVIAMRDLLT